ncbi:Protein kinase domain containing protein [Entamoeba marina]
MYRFFPPPPHDKNPKPPVHNNLSHEELRTKFLPIARRDRCPPTPLQKRFVARKTPKGVRIVTSDYVKRFDFQRYIGRGSYWDVNEVKDSEDSKTKVLKTSTRHNIQDSYIREFQTNGMIKDSTYLATMQETVSDGTKFYAVMDLYRCTIWDVIYKREMSEDEIIYTCWATLHALMMLNNMGFAHLDVKPENIFVAIDGRVKLGDFGNVRKFGECSFEDVGDGRYIAPEVLHNGIVTPQADVFSLGISLFEMSSRKRFPTSDDTFSYADYDSYLHFIQHEFIKNMFRVMTDSNYNNRLTARALLNYSIFQTISVLSIKE